MMHLEFQDGHLQVKCLWRVIFKLFMRMQIYVPFEWVENFNCKSFDSYGVMVYTKYASSFHKHRNKYLYILW